MGRQIAGKGLGVVIPIPSLLTPSRSANFYVVGGLHAVGGVGEAIFTVEFRRDDGSFVFILSTNIGILFLLFRMEHERL